MKHTVILITFKKTFKITITTKMIIKKWNYCKNVQSHDKIKTLIMN